jgi:hypothetical protein
MTLTQEALYAMLDKLVAEMPGNLASGPITTETNAWLGTACALVELSRDPGSVVALKVAAQNLNSPLREMNAQTIEAIVYAAQAKAKLLATPAGSQATVIQAGAVFTALLAVADVLREAKTDVLLIDPHFDERSLNHYALRAPESATIRVLAKGNKPTLKTAVERWRAEYPSRPLEVRLQPNKHLHDRAIQLDNTSIWTVGQSLNSLGVHSPTLLSPVSPEPAKLLIQAYAALWEAATPLWGVGVQLGPTNELEG